MVPTCSLMTICGVRPARDVTLMSSNANCGCGGRLGVDPGVVVVMDTVDVVVTVGVTAVRAAGTSGCGVLILGGCWGMTGLAIESWGSKVASRNVSFR